MLKPYFLFSDYTGTVNRLQKHFDIEDAPEICFDLGTSGPKFGKTNNPITFGRLLRLPFKDTPIVLPDGHDGTIDIIEISGQPVCVVQGRLHYYSGYNMDELLFISRVLALWGCKKFLLTNAAGGLNPNYEPGMLVNITDHIRMDVPDPLIGIRDERLGNKFADMQNPYTLSNVIKEVILSDSSALKPVKISGTYVLRSGPTFESLGESKMLKELGAHVVGMSCVPNVIILRSLGYDVGMITLVTNFTLAVQNQLVITHEDNGKVAESAWSRLIFIMEKVVEKLAT